MASTLELPPDPRLGGKTARYNQDETVSLLQAFYDFLPHIPSSAVHRAPAGGWPSITAEILEKRGIRKTPEVVELLRHLPYLGGDHPWIAPETFPCDYRILGQDDDRNTPGWVFDVQEDTGIVRKPSGTSIKEKWPSSVVQLTTGTDREGICWMLDTTDGTITRYCVVGYQYEPSYAQDDPRAWRDRMCDEDTACLADQLKTWQREYREMILLGATDARDGNGYPSLLFRSPGDKPGSFMWDEIEELRAIYLRHGWPDHYEKDACLADLREWSRTH